MLKLIIGLSFFAYSFDLKIVPSEFTLPSYTSPKNEVSFKYLKGKKTVINFWATWCTSCIIEVPELNKLKASDTSGEFHFLAISAGDTKKKIKKFIRKNGFNFDILMDKDRSVSKKWGVNSLPVTLVLDENGKILYQGNRPPVSLKEFLVKK